MSLSKAVTLTYVCTYAVKKIIKAGVLGGVIRIIWFPVTKGHFWGFTAKLCDRILLNVDTS